MNFRWNVAQYFEERWWRNYLSGKDSEEYLKWKKEYWKDFLLSINCMPKKGEFVLDAGCGPAGVCIILKDNPVIAVDPLLDIYENKLSAFETSKYPNVQFVRQPIEHFKSETRFDKIFCLNVINHVKSLNNTLKVFEQHAKKDAQLIISVDCHKYKFLNFIFKILPGDILHPHQGGKRGYNKLIEANGFKIEKSVCLKQELIFEYVVFLAKKI